MSCHLARDECVRPKAETFSKDVGPAHTSCDTQAKGSAGWSACVGAARASMSDDELFYAGYWLAKNGRYADALTYLNLARTQRCSRPHLHRVRHAQAG